MDIKLKAQNREKGIKASGLRAKRIIPAILYNHGKTDHIQVDEKEFTRLVYVQGISESTLISLDVEGKEEIAFIKDYQIHPVTDAILHVDFFRITYGEKIKTNVPIHLEGKPKGVKEGGVIETFLHEIEIETLPKDLKDSIKVDISHLELGDSLHLADLIIPEGNTIVTEGNPTICQVSVPAAMISEENTEEKETEGEEGEEAKEGEKEEKK